MQIKSKINIEDISRMSEIADVYSMTNQSEKSIKYHNFILKLCDRIPKDEKILQIRIHSLNCLNKPYKSLETTDELLHINPNNISALINIATYMRSD